MKPSVFLPVWLVIVSVLASHILWAHDTGTRHVSEEQHTVEQLLGRNLNGHYRRYLSMADRFSSFAEYEFHLNYHAYIKSKKRAILAGVLTGTGAAITAFGIYTIINEDNEDNDPEDFETDENMFDGLMITSLGAGAASAGVALLVIGSLKRARYKRRMGLLQQHLYNTEQKYNTTSPTVNLSVITVTPLLNSVSVGAQVTF